jgi:DNA invertase Pin-like site-specific DNA recombinase
MSPKTKPSAPVDIYLRVSRVGGREGDSYQSPEVQEERCRAQLVAHGYDVGRVFKDEDQSGGKMDRPAFAAAMERIKTGESGGMIVAKLNRFSRRVKDTLAGIAEIESHGAAFVSIEPTVDTSTKEGRFMLTVFSALNEMELEALAEGWKVSVGNAIDKGKFISRYVPAGYTRTAQGRLVPDPVAAPVIAEIFRLRGRGASWGTLQRYLEEHLPDGPPARKDPARKQNPSASWPLGTVTGILRSRAYLGESRQGDNIPVNKTAHKPIVTRLEWEMAQSTRGRAASDSTGALLAGIVRCSSCGFAMSRQSAGARKNGGRYRCFKNHASGVCPSPTSISATALDAYIIEGMQAELDKLPRKQTDTTTRDETFAAATAALEAAEQEMAVYLDSVSAALIGAEAFASGAASRREAIERAQKALAAVQTAVTLPTDPAEAWKVMDEGERRRFLLATGVVFVKPTPARGKGSLIDERVKWVAFEGHPGLADTLPGRKNKEMRGFDW